MDEACAGMASRIGITPVSYKVLSGDAVPFTPVSVIEENVVKNIVPGAIIIMHFNHPFLVYEFGNTAFVIKDNGW